MVENAKIVLPPERKGKSLGNLEEAKVVHMEGFFPVYLTLLHDRIDASLHVVMGDAEIGVVVVQIVIVVVVVDAVVFAVQVDAAAVEPHMLTGCQQNVIQVYSFHVHSDDLKIACHLQVVHQ